MTAWHFKFRALGDYLPGRLCQENCLKKHTQSAYMHWCLICMLNYLQTLFMDSHYYYWLICEYRMVLKMWIIDIYWNRLFRWPLLIVELSRNDFRGKVGEWRRYFIIIHAYWKRVGVCWLITVHDEFISVVFIPVVEYVADDWLFCESFWKKV